MNYKIDKDQEIKECTTNLMRLIRAFNTSSHEYWPSASVRRELHSMKFYLSEIADNVQWYRKQIEAIETAIQANQDKEKL